MPAESEPLYRIHVTLFASDVKWLQRTCRDTSGISRTVRKIVRAAIREVDSRVEEKSVKVEPKP